MSLFSSLFGGLGVNYLEQRLQIPSKDLPAIVYDVNERNGTAYTAQDVLNIDQAIERYLLGRLLRQATPPKAQPVVKPIATDAGLGSGEGTTTAPAAPETAAQPSGAVSATSEAIEAPNPTADGHTAADLEANGGIAVPGVWPASTFGGAAAAP